MKVKHSIVKITFGFKKNGTAIIDTYHQSVWTKTKTLNEKKKKLTKRISPCIRVCSLCRRASFYVTAPHETHCNDPITNKYSRKFTKYYRRRMSFSRRWSMSMTTMRRLGTMVQINLQKDNCSDSPSNFYLTTLVDLKICKLQKNR